MVPLEILLLYHRPSHVPDTVLKHIGALMGLSKHRVRGLRIFGDLPSQLDLNRFDVIVIHYSLIACDDRYIAPEARRQISTSSALKVLFVQDEYRHVDKSVAAFRALGVDLLFTCVPTDEIEKVYPDSQLPGVRKVNVLTGYIDEGLVRRHVPSYEERSTDVGYRARRMPAWLGDLAQEKWFIAVKFNEDAPKWGLSCDIKYREEERLYGDRWIDFVTRCKAILGVESGASVFDFTGNIQKGVEADLYQDPKLSYSVLRSRHFANQDGKIRLNQISPRCFEAAALRTLMILYPGEYSGVLVPWRHYVPLAKDHSNMAEVVKVIRSPPIAQQIIEQAFQEVARNSAYTFPAFVNHFDDEVTRASQAKRITRATPYSQEEFQKVTRSNFRMLRQRFQWDAIMYAYKSLFNVALGGLSETHRDVIDRTLRRFWNWLETRRSHSSASRSKGHAGL